MSLSLHPEPAPLDPRGLLTVMTCPRRWALERQECGSDSAARSYEELQRNIACDAAERSGLLRDVEVGDHRLRGRIDFLEPCESGYRIIVCRGALRLKGRTREEFDILVLAARLSGYEITGAEILLVNRDYQVLDPLRPDQDQLFNTLPLQLPSDDKINAIETELDRVRSVLGPLRDADPAMYPACGRARCRCKLHELPDHNVFTLFLSSGTAERLFEQGVQTVHAIPEDAKLGRRQKIQRQAVINNSVHIDRERLQDFVQHLKYPIGYLDFEAISSPVPLYAGTQPWQYIPFLYSFHLEKAMNACLSWYHHYCRPENDGRVEFAESLAHAIAQAATVVVFDASLERRIVKSLADGGFLRQRDLEQFEEKLLDLLPLFREFGWYSPQQRGSVSLKAILPLMTDEVGYDQLDVGDGLSASLEYLGSRRRALRNTAPNPDSADVENNLVEYCKVDTLALHHIVRRVREITDGAAHSTPSADG